MVYGTCRRAGYTNNNLSQSVLKVLMNEAGVDAISEVGALAGEAEVLAAVVEAQAKEMEAEEYDDEGEVERLAKRMKLKALQAASVVKSPVVPSHMDTTVDATAVQAGGNAGNAKAIGNVGAGNAPPTPQVVVPVETGLEPWRVYEHAVTRKEQRVPIFKTQLRDSGQLRKRKARHHQILERYARRFIEHGMWSQVLRVVSFMKSNNLSGMKGVKSFTDVVRAEIVSLLPIVSLVVAVEETTTAAGPGDEDPKTLATKNASDVSLIKVCVQSHMCLPPCPKICNELTRPPFAPESRWLRAP
jgi:hypothetical protein